MNEKSPLDLIQQSQFEEIEKDIIHQNRPLQKPPSKLEKPVKIEKPKKMVDKKTKPAKTSPIKV